MNRRNTAEIQLGLIYRPEYQRGISNQTNNAHINERSTGTNTLPRLHDTMTGRGSELQRGENDRTRRWKCGQNFFRQIFYSGESYGILCRIRILWEIGSGFVRDQHKCLRGKSSQGVAYRRRRRLCRRRRERRLKFAILFTKKRK